MITILIPTPIITILKNISVEVKDGTVTGGILFPSSSLSSPPKN
jgi:hypothetical protein